LVIVSFTENMKDGLAVTYFIFFESFEMDYSHLYLPYIFFYISHHKHMALNTNILSY
jgi:hypothetical protein